MSARIAGSGYVAQLREILGDYEARRVRLVTVLTSTDDSTAADTVERLNSLLASVERDIVRIERDIARAERRLVRRHAPDIHFRSRQLDLEISALRLQCLVAQPRRRSLGPRRRRLRTCRTSHGPTGRCSDDDEHDRLGRLRAPRCRR